MLPVPIIGLCGFALSGKTTLANELAKQGYAIASFAAALKARADPLFPQEAPKSLRRGVYVEYGRAMRAIDADYWINAMRIPERPFIIDDCRYFNEVRWIQSRGGVVFYIQRSGVVPANAEEDMSISVIHATFTLPVIVNNSTPQEAAQQVLRMLGKEAA